MSEEEGICREPEEGAQLAEQMYSACWPGATWVPGACTTLLLDIMSTRGWSITLRNASTHADSLYIFWLQICHCKSCRTSCLSKTKPLYYILNQRSVTAKHPGCLVTTVGLQMDFMASRVNTWTRIGTTGSSILPELSTQTHRYNLNYNCVNNLTICTFHLLLLINLSVPQIRHDLDIPEEFPYDPGSIPLCNLCSGIILPLS